MREEICEECGRDEPVVKCVSCQRYLCEDCANDNHGCLVEAVDELKSNLYADVDDLEEIEED